MLFESIISLSHLQFLTIFLTDYIIEGHRDVIQLLQKTVYVKRACHCETMSLHSGKTEGHYPDLYCILQRPFFTAFIRDIELSYSFQDHNGRLLNGETTLQWNGSTQNLQLIRILDFFLFFFFYKCVDQWKKQHY